MRSPVQSWVPLPQKERKVYFPFFFLRHKDDTRHIAEPHHSPSHPHTRQPRPLRRNNCLSPPHKPQPRTPQATRAATSAHREDCHARAAPRAKQRATLLTRKSLFAPLKEAFCPIKEPLLNIRQKSPSSVKRPTSDTTDGLHEPSNPQAKAI